MADPRASLRFCGGAGTVTGSKYLIEYDGRKILLEAGLFQGLKSLRLRNWSDPPFDPAQISAVVLSHAHLDHSGYLPLLVRKGFRGKIYCTSATADLLGILLPDSAHLLEEEAEWANRKGYSKHKPALPLYSMADVEPTLKLLQSRPFHESFEVESGLSATFNRAGHILGSATVELQCRRSDPFRIVFSGDLGRWDRPILRDPEFVAKADLLLLESTYGDRVHPTNTDEELAQVIRESAAKGGALIIPAFAVGRAQELIWWIRQLEDQDRIPALPVYMDSPMAIAASEIYRRHPEEHDLDMRALIVQHRNPLATRRFALIRTPDESKALNDVIGPMIIIAASGMATGGRVLHHLRWRLPDHRTTVLLVGYQAAGTRGRSLQDGAKTLRMHGQEVPVKAKIEKLAGLSAHADRDEILRWLGGFKTAPKQVYLVHGEPRVAHHLSGVIQSRLGWNVRIAEDRENIQF